MSYSVQKTDEIIGHTEEAVVGIEMQDAGKGRIAVQIKMKWGSANLFYEELINMKQNLEV